MTPTAPTGKDRSARGISMPWVDASTPGPMAPHEFEIECLEAIAETPNIMSFVFRRTDGIHLAFRPGQYLNVAFPAGEDGALVERNYSISSTPMFGGGELIRLTIKREPSGLVSSWAHEHLRPGMVLEALGPLGTFHPLDHERRARFLLLAGGVGITPILSIAATFNKMPGDSSIVVLYHASNAEEFALAQDLRDLVETDPRVTMHLSLGDQPDENWTGLAGRLDASVIESLVPDACGRKVFACGPPGYLDRVAEVVQDLAVSPNSYLTESFLDSVQTADAVIERREHGDDAEGGIPAPASLPGDVSFAQISLPGYDEALAAADEPMPDEWPVPVPGVHVAPDRAEGDERPWVTFARTGRSVPVEEGQTLLEAGVAGGVALRSNCANGMCGTCKVRTLSGEVTMNDAGGIRAREVRDGFILACCSTPRGDVVLDA